MEVRLWPRVWLPPRSGAEDPPADVWRRAGLEREGHLGHPDRGEQRPRHLQHKGNLSCTLGVARMVCLSHGCSLH